jgi:hypothetical protein
VHKRYSFPRDRRVDPERTHALTTLLISESLREDCYTKEHVLPPVVGLIELCYFNGKLFFGIPGVEVAEEGNN